ncbi:MAG: FAD-dependent monooxygenase [Acidobacteria bacterium]|nr:FAD-dependent monooxygenase [Acidobacteriota bacterium]
MSASSNRKAIIIGGGIGGLCAAIALRQQGVEAQVFERVATLKEVGAGLSLWLNAIKALDKLGMAETLQALSIPQISGGIRTSSGDLISGAMPEAVQKRFGAALILMVHRAELHTALLEKLGKENVRLAAECCGFEQDDEGVTARFSDGQTVRGDFLLGADGINSVIRAQLFAPAKPRYAGYTAWRAVTKFDSPFFKHGASESWGRGARFGLIPMSEGRVYWFATKNTKEGAADAARGRKREVAECFRGWHQPIEAAIAATEEQDILRNDIYDRQPLPSWTKGRVTLLGDAAHPMTPNLGQGACQAIEDAVELADSVSHNRDLLAALQTYEARRLQRTNKIATQSWRIGKMGQLENAFARILRNSFIKLIPAAMQMKQLEWIIGYEA